MKKTPSGVSRSSLPHATLDRMSAEFLNRYLAKPFSPLELLSVVEDLLERGQSRLAG